MTDVLHTCQICARAIKANTGLIAHHGYKRPGQGWQTASCMGAKYRPYEIACDALPRAIASCAAYIEKVERTIEAGPPAKLTYEQRGGTYGRTTIVEVLRPEGFDPARKDYLPRSFSTLWSNRLSRMQHDLAGSRESLKFLEARLAAWVAP